VFVAYILLNAGIIENARHDYSAVSLRSLLVTSEWL
jgi:hypothetical protein